MASAILYMDRKDLVIAFSLSPETQHSQHIVDLHTGATVTTDLFTIPGLGKSSD